jgi:hypothetical protein
MKRQYFINRPPVRHIILIGAAALLLVGAVAIRVVNSAGNSHPVDNLRLAWDQNRRAFDEYRRAWDDKRRARDEQRRAREEEARHPATQHELGTAHAGSPASK